MPRSVDPLEVEELVGLLTPAERAEFDALLVQGMPSEPPQLIDEEHAPQAAFIRDLSRLKVLLCTRRAGKSFGIAVEFLVDGWRHPRANYLYIGLTRDSAKKAVWKDGLKALDRAFSLDLKFNESDLTCTLPNGAVIYVLGMDAGEQQKEKARGGKYRKVAVDEAQSFGIDLRSLVMDVLRPAVADERGTIILAGTPGLVRDGLFFDLTRDQDPQSPGVWTQADKLTAGNWSGHRWNAGKNPHMRAQWESEIADMMAVNPQITETPKFQREYLGRWVMDDANLVYRFQPGHNTFTQPLPNLARGRWHYVLGIDLGFNDATAWSVCAYHDFDRTLYVLEAEKHERLDITDVAQRTRTMMGRYEFDSIVIDNANKQAVEEMRRRHELPLTPADKAGKADFIELMNGEFVQGRIKLDPVRCAGLAEEYGGLIWDTRSARREEHPASPNHLCDATLYAWRHCYAYLSEAPKARPAQGSAEALDAEACAMEEAEEAALATTEAERRLYETSDDWGWQ